jgi:uncharacterized membrane protein
MNYKVTYKRHLGKTISYRLISSLISFIGIWALTDSAEVGAVLSLTELLYKPFLYFIHERVWYKKIKYGLVEKQDPPQIEQIPQVEPTITEPIQQTTDGKKILNYNSNR